MGWSLKVQEGSSFLLCRSLLPWGYAVSEKSRLLQET